MQKNKNTPPLCGTPLQEGNQGFTLVELLVATSIFTIVAVYGVSILLTSQNAYQRIAINRNATDNLNLVMDIMTRDIRYGLNYGCVNDNSSTDFKASNITTFKNNKDDITINCNAVAFNSQDQEIASTTVFYLDTNFKRLNKVDYKCNSVTGNSCQIIGDYPMTTSDLRIDKFIIKVQGSKTTEDPTTADFIQPSVAIFLSGIIKLRQNLPGQISGTSTFALQSFVSQKLLDK